MIRKIALISLITSLFSLAHINDPIAIALTVISPELWTYAQKRVSERFGLPERPDLKYLILRKLYEHTQKNNILFVDDKNIDAFVDEILIEDLNELMHNRLGYKHFIQGMAGRYGIKNKDNGSYTNECVLSEFKKALKIVAAHKSTGEVFKSYLLDETLDELLDGYIEICKQRESKSYEVYAIPLVGEES